MRRPMHVRHPAARHPFLPNATPRSIRAMCHGTCVDGALSHPSGRSRSAPRQRPHTRRSQPLDNPPSFQKNVLCHTSGPIVGRHDCHRDCHRDLASSLTADAVHSAGCPTHTDSRTRSGRKMKSDRPPVIPPPRTCTMSWPCNYACLAHCRHRERDSDGWMGGPGVGCPAASTCCGMRGICGDVISTSIGLHRALR